MGKFNTDYDEEEDNLFLYSKEKSKGSIEIGNLILDFNSKGNLVALEFINATSFLKDSVSSDNEAYITKTSLSSINKCTVEAKQRQNFLFIKIVLHINNKAILIPITAPMIREKSPALAYA